MTTTSPTLNAQLSITGQNVGVGGIAGTSLVEQINIQSLLQLLPGAGAGQANLVFEDNRTLAAGASENLDLSGALKDRFGNVLTMMHVKLILIRASAANVNSVAVGGAATNTFQGPFGSVLQTIHVQPGEVFLATFANGVGWPVVAGTGDILQIGADGSGTGVNYDVLIVGTST